MSILVFALGAVLGSFLNVCVYRLPRDLSLVRPGSACPACRAPIRWFDNIPLLSYIALRGRCRGCRAPISPRYWMVELLSGALLLSAYLRFGLSAAGAFFGLFALLLVLVTFIDWEHHLIPVGEVVLPGIVIGLLFRMFFAAPAPGRPISGLAAGLTGAMVGAGLIMVVAGLGRLAFRKEAMGEGDIWLMAMIGAFLGWRAVLLTIFIASLTGSVVGVALMSGGRRRRDDPIPFGPFLSLGALTALFFGDALLRWYLGRL